MTARKKSGKCTSSAPDEEAWEACGAPTGGGPCTRTKGHLSPSHWHIGTEDEGPYVCPGCCAVAAPCLPGCIDAEILRDQEGPDA